MKKLLFSLALLTVLPTVAMDQKKLDINNNNSQENLPSDPIPVLTPTEECIICMTEAQELDENQLFITSCCKKLLCHNCYKKNNDIGIQKKLCPQRCNEASSKELKLKKAKIESLNLLDLPKDVQMLILEQSLPHEIATIEDFIRLEKFFSNLERVNKVLRELLHDERFINVFAKKITKEKATEFLQIILNKFCEAGLSHAIQIMPSLKSLRILNNAGADINISPDNFYNGFTALHGASKNGQYELVHYLLNNGANVNERHLRASPLILASLYGHPKIAKSLVKKDADIHIYDDFGNNILAIAAQQGNLELVKFFTKCVTSPNSKNYLGSTFNGYKPFINNQNSFGDTPLSLATKSGHLLIVQFLLENTAEINQQNKKGESPLMLAVKNQRYNLIEYLISMGADMNCKDKEGKTVYDFATNPMQILILGLSACMAEKIK